MSTSTGTPTGKPTAPTVAPTPVTRAPTLEPTAAPTLAPPNCTDGDELNFNSSSYAFDSDMKACAISCPWQTVALAKVNVCITECFSDKFHRPAKEYPIVSTIYTPQCGSCFGEWARCMVSDVCRCPFGRGQNSGCAACADKFCTPSFLNCTGFDELPALATEAPQEEGFKLSSTALTGIIIGAALLSVLGLSALIVGARRGWKTRKALLSAGMLDSHAAIPASGPSEMKGRPKNRPKGDFSKVAELGSPLGSGAGSFVTSNSYSSASPMGSSSGFGSAQFGGSRGGNSGPKTCVAVYEAVAGASDEISCPRGTVLEIIKEVDQDWIIVRDPNTGNEGLIPSNIVKRK
jgi:hypothetical protein